MGVAYNMISQYLPFIRKKSVPTRDQVLNVRPLRNPLLEWDASEDGETRLLIPRRKDLLGRVLCRLFRAPDHKEIVLDEVGSEIWELCDGEHSVQSIIAATCKKHKLTRRECEVSVGTYLQTLSQRRLLLLPMGGRRGK